MSIKINQNIFSLLVRRNLEKSSDKLESSYAKLSSGERLTRAADDPAAMAMSEQVRYQIRGLRQNQENVSSSISLLGTAESQISGMVDSLQRLRELAVQGANDTLSASNRASIQTEIDQLVEDLETSATGSQFSGRYLFNGTFSDVSIQVGTGSTDTIPLSFGDFRTSKLGAVSMLASSDPVSTAAITAGTLFINQTAIPASSADGVSTVNADASAIAKANAINSVEARTGVHADVLAATTTGSSALGAVNIDGITRNLWINGVAISPVQVQAGDDTGALAARINATTNQTGVTASVDADGKLTLSAEDGRNIEIKTQGSIADELGLSTTDGDVTQVVCGKVQLTSSSAFTINDTGDTLGLSQTSMQVDPDLTTAISGIDVINSASATAAILSIDTALAQLSDCRSGIGAIQNRLEALTSDLAAQVQDLTSTDSRLRDTDFALETTQLTQAQILQEAATSILSQANVAPRRALELLQQN